MNSLYVFVACILYSQIWVARSYSKIKPINRTHFEIDIKDIMDVNKNVDDKVKLTIYETSGVIGQIVLNRTNMKETMTNNVLPTDLCCFKLYQVISHDLKSDSVHHLTSFLWEPWNYLEVSKTR